MATTKTVTVAFRIDLAVKEALRTAAAREHRSIANIVEVLIRDHCGRNAIAIPEQSVCGVTNWAVWTGGSRPSPL